MKEFLTAMLVTISVCATLVVVGIKTKSTACTSQWPSTFKPQWEFFSGCTIEVKGVRIPSINYRVL